MHKKYQPSLKIYVMWHPKFNLGKHYAEQIYSNFGREIQTDIIYRRPGIPVFFINDTDKAINLDEAKHTAIIVLVDDEMVIDSEWDKFLGELQQAVKGRKDGKHRIYPVSLSKHAFHIESIRGINYIRLHEINDEKKKLKRLLVSATHEISRLLLNHPRVAGETDLSTVPVSLFLSHAKKDGAELAQSIKCFIHQETSLKTFFDATDIAAGYSFSKEISQSIKMKETALLVLHTDTYSSRDWCRKEVIQAKLSNIPIVVVNLIAAGEERSFPYLGNVPTIRWDGSKEMIGEIIHLTLTEILRDLYTKLHLESLTDIYEVADRVHTITHHPELLSFVKIIEEEGDTNKLTVLYPDPPLGYEEIQLLTSIKPMFKFLTPTMLPIMRYAEQETSGDQLDILKSIKVGLSISDSPDLKSYGISDMHLEDALVEFSRYLLVSGAKLMYGGDLRHGGFTEILHNLVRNYFPEDVQSAHKIHNYQAWPLYLNIPTETRAELNKVVTFEMIEPPENIQKTNIFLPPNCKENRVIWAKSLSKMREEMNKNLDVRVLMGGAVQNYKGKYPGLLEEAFLALRDGKPLYLLGGFGGCTRAIIEVLLGNTPEELSEDFQISNMEYLEMVQEYNTKKENDEPIAYENMLAFFKEKGIGSLNNGLTDQENLTLFFTPHIPEMISLVLKGLANVANR
ncbi:TIR domain-containing protein [Bacillus toyonensis]|uniref:TIR domain-containing protein n=1 Tax=Bacillus toyonensis TaxID=155322 RepID=UPI002119C44D|nr:TIR domain-containing protein [Bacillus toyonensis]MED3201288.1 TIR domain-containing protein [Bacillus toyonensis]